jgi:N-acetylglucosaminyldiphosphoundecaprenol N-acetyl-beta-D-mannosaminyltransferase
MKTIRLFDLEFIDDEDYKALLMDIASNKHDEWDSLPLLITPNVDQIVKLYREENHEIMEAAKKARYVLPDGQPLVWLSRWKHGKRGLSSRLTGSDLFPELWSHIKSRGESVLMILPNDGLGSRFKAEYPLCQAYSPPFFTLEDEAAYGGVLETCKQLLSEVSYRHVLVGLGFPKQERLALDLIKHSDQSSGGPLFYLLGASFEFYYGTKSRAPKWVQRLGLEFLHRMISEPKRMIKRYLWDDLAFLPLAWKEWRKPSSD